jgi:hypothetical protein
MKTALNDKGIRPNDIMGYAKICRVDKIIKPILETMVSGYKFGAERKEI